MTPCKLNSFTQSNGFHIWISARNKMSPASKIGEWVIFGCDAYITMAKIINRVGRNQKNIITLSHGYSSMWIYEDNERSIGLCANELKKALGKKAKVLMQIYGINNRFAFFIIKRFF